MTRWVVAEWSSKRGKAHLLRADRLVWAYCWRNLGNSVTTDDARPKCKACLAAERREKGRRAK